MGAADAAGLLSSAPSVSSVVPALPVARAAAAFAHRGEGERETHTGKALLGLRP